MVRPTPVLTCYRTRRRLGAYLDGALDPEASRAIAAHVSVCARCAAEVRSLTRLRVLVRAIPQPSDPDWSGFWPGIVRRVDDAKRAPVRRRAASSRMRWAFGGALAAAFVASVTLWQLAPWDSSSGKITEDPVVVRSADTADPGATVMVYSTPEHDLTVVWVFGLDRSQ